jgi:hypothetical protein
MRPEDKRKVAMWLRDRIEVHKVRLHGLSPALRLAMEGHILKLEKTAEELEAQAKEAEARA